ncbi:DUF5700 domain-containing putative Zn-dependent protease [Kosmotoga olearia]|uniref:DUF2268 domain-containing protein n=1 Tax=Kosmotoga olearia (strain ATCC BAA-1733 / DSM 21960 / TBF 19.5.1) TaxID=521045 RepID=C5CGA8_KOSOT|nr:DUF5700 domain-containing putative Zn-dependent protease [Kosmotoga olearia]ACR79549.1 hypothetical protein Kole_0839 [Kosmotoga olearia TBF 19.5.1]
MKVSFDFEPIDYMIELFHDVKKGIAVNPQTIDKLLSHDAIKQMIKHYNRPDGSNANIMPEDLKHVFLNLDRENLSSENDFLIEFHKNLKDKFDRLDELESFLKQLKEKQEEITNFAQKKLQRFLPQGIDFEPRIFIIFTGYSGGYFVGNDITLDLEHISKSLDKVASTIAHELHHIAFNGIVENTLLSGQLPANKNMLAELIAGLAGEGIAYYCVGGDPEKGLIGFEDNPDYQSDLKRWKSYFQEVNDVMLKLLNDELTTEEFFGWASKHMSKTFGAINMVGIKTIEAIYRAGGDGEVLGVVENPAIYVRVYNNAATYLNENKKTDYPLFDSRLEEVFG